MRYTFLGDKLTDDALRGMQCDPVLRSDGKCIVGRNGNALVQDGAGRRYVVPRRRLRLNSKLRPTNLETLQMSRRVIVHIVYPRTAETIMTRPILSEHIGTWKEVRGAMVGAMLSGGLWRVALPDGHIIQQSDGFPSSRIIPVIPS